MKFILDSIMSFDVQELVATYGEKVSPFEIKIEPQKFINFLGNEQVVEIATIELNSLDDLKLLSDKVGYQIIFSNIEFYPQSLNMSTLKIYDGYNE